MGSQNFQKAISRTLAHEGGYSFNPIDPGGETMWGITARTAHKYGYKGEMKYLPREEAIRIYEEGYWNEIRGDDLPFPLAFQLFDAAVNSGPPQAILWLQRAVGVKDDGIFGPITLSAARSQDAGRAALSFLIQRWELQTTLYTWPSFGKGWTKRNLKNLQFILDDTQSEA